MIFSKRKRAERKAGRGRPDVLVLELLAVPPACEHAGLDAAPEIFAANGDIDTRCPGCGDLFPVRDVAYDVWSSIHYAQRPGGSRRQRRLTHVRRKQAGRRYAAACRRENALRAYADAVGRAYEAFDSLGKQLGEWQAGLKSTVGA